MRILVVNHTPTEGSGTGVYTDIIARELRNLGHQTAVIAPSGTRTEVPYRHYKVGYYGRAGHWSLRFPFPSFSGHPLSNLLYSQLSESQLNEYVTVWQCAISDAVADFSPDVIYVNHCFLLGYCVATTCDIPFVLIAHGSEVRREIGERFDTFSLCGVLNATALIANTAETVELIRSKFALTKDISIINSGFDPAIFHKKLIDKDDILKSNRGHKHRVLRGLRWENG